MPNKKTQEQFIEDAIKKYGVQYDYSLVEYINCKIKVKILCPKHGVFEQTPDCHLKQLGCPKCTNERRSDSQKMEINSDTSYMIGLFQTDGCMSKGKGNKGRLSLEISIKDEDIISKLEKIIPYHCGIRKRRRKTHINNYNYNNETISINVNALAFRTFLVESGVPYGKKSKIIKPPLHLSNLLIKDYVRGLYDGDGSLGFKKDGYPFVSFTTDSDDIANFLIEYISEITGKSKKVFNRNNRDNIYNIVIGKEDAVKFCNELYYEDCLSLNRKYNIAQDVKKWVRPDTMRSEFCSKRWNKDQDEFILNHSVEESMEYLDRTENSIEMRLWRLSEMGFESED